MKKMLCAAAVGLFAAFGYRVILNKVGRTAVVKPRDGDQAGHSRHRDRSRRRWGDRAEGALHAVYVDVAP
jgi:hypothetical protein